MIRSSWIVRLVTGVINLGRWVDRRREARALVVSEATPRDTGEAVAQARWDAKTIDVLCRVADGDTRLRPEGQDDAARTEFDDLVEMVLALQRRGLLHCSTPIAELKRRDAMYAEITNVVLTDEGRRVLAVPRASPPPTASAAEGHGPTDRSPRVQA